MNTRRNRLIVLCLTLLLFLQGERGLSQDVLTWNHGQHFTAGLIIGGVGATLSNRPVLAGSVCGLGAGLAKEWHDHHYHGARFDAHDAAFTFAGGIVSGLVVKKLRTVLFNKHKHKKKRK